MEIGLKQFAPPTEKDASRASASETARVFKEAAGTGMHTGTNSTLSPTSEYVRYLLLVLPARYIPRGIIEILYKPIDFTGNIFAKALNALASGFQKLFPIAGNLTEKQLDKVKDQKAAFAYSTLMGIGSLAMTLSYSRTVYADIKNIFAEAVAMENGKAPKDIIWSDLKRSDNRIVQKTLGNFWKRLLKRVVTDLAFFPAAMTRHPGAGDTMVGIKAVQALAETWKRKTTMFEDLVSFINNKINPRNGLGQEISIGEIFDLYQHYAEGFNPDKMFNNVVGQDGPESVRWNKNQATFNRITELMNLSYPYKHNSVIDEATGRVKPQADFTLPKFIYLLGHDLIDIDKPEQTLATVEIANRFGISAVKEMQTMLARGATLHDVTERFPIPAPTAPAKTARDVSNGVRPRGSTRQLDQGEETPASKIDAATALHQPTYGPLAGMTV